MLRIEVFLIVAGFLLFPGAQTSLGCACGCGVFTVGTHWLMVTTTGPRLFLQYSYIGQDRNWTGISQASAALNSDRLITTSFYNAGIQYMVNREWGVMAEVPVWDRYREGFDAAGHPFTVRHHAMGDMKISAIYTGFSEDMSTALLAGIKLPTGPTTQSLLDRDTQIGTGTTDLLLSASQMGQQDDWGWFAQAALVEPLAEHDGYKPGRDVNIAVGIHYDDLIRPVGLVPMLSLVTSFRAEDSGINSDPANTGSSRVVLFPGVEYLLTRSIHVDLDFGIPLSTNIHGYQLISPWLLNSTLSYQL